MTNHNDHLGLVDTCLKQTYFSEEELVKRPAEILEQFGFLPSEPGPVDIERFVERIADFSYSGNLPEDIDGVTMFTLTDQPKVIIPERLAMNGASVVYLRSTIAHECAHVVFHNDCFKQAYYDGLLGSPIEPGLLAAACRTHRAEEGYCWYEWQAKFAGASFLMPYMHVRTLFYRIMETLPVRRTSTLPQLMGYVRVVLADEIRKVFEVGFQMSNIAAEKFMRRNALSIINLIQEQKAF